MAETNQGQPVFFALHGRATSIIIEAPPGEAPLWRYWGPRLPEGTTPPGALRAARPTPSFSLDADQPLSLLPLFGAGWFHQPALMAHRAGKDFAQRITAAAVETAANALRIMLQDSVAGLEIELLLALDPASDVLTASTSITNRGADAIDIQALSSVTLVLPGGGARIRYFAGRHNREFEEREEPLTHALWRRENRRGLTSHEVFPGALVLMDGAGRDHGLVYAAQIAWSGNHIQTIERVDDGRRQWQLGEWLAPGELQLAPGETAHSPEILATCSADGSNGAARNFHRALRARVRWPRGSMKPRPAHLNTWEAFYFNHRLDELMALASEAAKLGVERFVLDDGWFKGRDNDRSSLGDWTADPAKYPQGLMPLAGHVVGLGMEFGLWVEPEMVSPDSELFRAHPEWALHLEGRPRITGRNQLVLDMTRPDVRAYLFKSLDGLLAALPISYLKWDHNRDLTCAGDAEGRAAYRRQTLGAYSLMADVRTAHPDVEIEACAGGGGRIDAGVLQWTHRFWASDCLDAVTRLSVQRGFLQFMPPELMGSHIGASPAHSTGRAQSMELRAAVAATGHFGFEVDVRRLDPNDLATARSWMEFYKRHRRLIHGGDIWLGEAGDGVLWQAHGTASDFLLFVFRIDPAADRYAPPIRLPMADPARRYHVSIEQGWQRRGRITGGELFSALAENGAEIAGAWLKEAGLSLPPMLAESAAVFRMIAK